MRSDNNCAGNLYRKSSLGVGARRAGTGIVEDDYSDDSSYERFGERPAYERYTLVRFPNDSVKPEELNGEVIIVQAGKKKEDVK